MGIDVHLIWNGMTDEDRQRQTFVDLAASAERANDVRSFGERGGEVTAEMVMGSVVPTTYETRGAAGYIREGYGISPFPSALLVKEAFEADDGHAAIPASVMRERLHSVTEPASRNIGAFMGWFKKAVSADFDTPDAPYTQTEPATVWECVQLRASHGQQAGGRMQATEIMLNYIEFVKLAELKEREQGHPCRVFVSR